jgi:hypothetical protein
MPVYYPFFFAPPLLVPAFFVAVLRFGSAFLAVFRLGAAFFLVTAAFFTALRFGADLAVPFFLVTDFFLAVARLVMPFFVTLCVVAINPSKSIKKISRVSIVHFMQNTSHFVGSFMPFNRDFPSL